MQNEPHFFVVQSLTDECKYHIIRTNDTISMKNTHAC